MCGGLGGQRRVGGKDRESRRQAGREWGEGGGYHWPVLLGLMWKLHSDLWDFAITITFVRKLTSHP